MAGGADHQTAARVPRQLRLEDGLIRTFLQPNSVKNHQHVFNPTVRVEVLLGRVKILCISHHLFGLRVELVDVRGHVVRQRIGKVRVHGGLENKHPGVVEVEALPAVVVGSAPPGEGLFL